MSNLRKKQSAAVDKVGAMLKHVPPEDFKEVLTAMVLKCKRLNEESVNKMEDLTELVDELYLLLQRSWPGVRPTQIWATLKNGMAKQGQYRVRITYPTLANWLMYHRVLKTEPESSKEKELGEPIESQVNRIVNGLAEYRKRVASGEYQPKGRES